VCKETLFLRECDRLGEASNYVPFNIGLQIVVKDIDIFEHVEKVIPEPTDPTQLDALKRGIKG
jgi:hypothetical protein